MASIISVSAGELAQPMSYQLLVNQTCYTKTHKLTINRISFRLRLMVLMAIFLQIVLNLINKNEIECKKKQAAK